MAIGSYMGQVFQVSEQKIFTPSRLQGSTGSDWVSHEVFGGKAKSQWLGPKRRTYTMEITLRWQDGVNPRQTLEVFQQAAESDQVDWVVIGSKPLSEHPFQLVEVSDAWDVVLGSGKLLACSVTLKLEEYV